MVKKFYISNRIDKVGPVPKTVAGIIYVFADRGSVEKYTSSGDYVITEIEIESKAANMMLNDMARRIAHMTVKPSSPPDDKKENKPKQEEAGK